MSSDNRLQRRLLVASLGRSFALVPPPGRVRESAPVAMREPRQLAGKSAPPCRATSLGRRFPALRLTASAGWNRHQRAPNVSVPAAIPGSDAVAVETPSGLIDALSVRTRLLRHPGSQRIVVTKGGHTLVAKGGLPAILDNRRLRARAFAGIG
jgi:hypothetical protein